MRHLDDQLRLRTRRGAFGDRVRGAFGKGGGDSEGRFQEPYAADLTELFDDLALLVDPMRAHVNQCIRLIEPKKSAKPLCFFSRLKSFP